MDEAGTPQNSHAKSLSIITTLAARLTVEGVPTATGNAVWQHATIARIVKGFVA